MANVAIDILTCEIITGVSIRCIETKYIWMRPRPYRHNHVMDDIYEVIQRQVTRAEYEQGFTTDRRGFISRKEAYELAIANGQFKRNNNCTLKELFSEDLW